MGNFKDFPKTGAYYFTRRGKFKVLSVKGKMVTIEWQDNRDRVEIEKKELKSMLISEQYAGDPDTYVKSDDTPYRGRRPMEDSNEEEESG
jgi:hypothetical protein